MVSVEVAQTRPLYFDNTSSKVCELTSTKRTCNGLFEGYYQDSGQRKLFVRLAGIGNWIGTKKIATCGGNPSGSMLRIESVEAGA